MAPDWFKVSEAGVLALNIGLGGFHDGRPYLAVQVDPAASPVDPYEVVAAYAAQNLHRRLMAASGANPIAHEHRQLTEALADTLAVEAAALRLEFIYRARLTELLVQEIAGDCPPGALCRLAVGAPLEAVKQVRPRLALVWVNPTPVALPSRRTRRG